MPSTKSELRPSGSHQLPISSAPPGSPIARDQTNEEERRGPRARIAAPREHCGGPERARDQPDVEPALDRARQERVVGVEHVDQRDAGEADDRERAGDRVADRARIGVVLMFVLHGDSLIR